MELINYPYFFKAGLIADSVLPTDLVIIGRKDVNIEGGYRSYIGNASLFVSAASQPKKYAAQIHQTGATAPVEDSAAINTIGTVVWKRTGVGVYQLTRTGAFPDANKVVAYAPVGNGDDVAIFFKVEWIDADTIEYTTSDKANVLTDALMATGAFVTVEVYP